VDLTTAYAAYLDCLNARRWDELGHHVADDVRHDDRPLGLAGYRRMLERDVAAIPDLRFVAEDVVASGDVVAVRLAFDCHPVGELFGVAVDGRRVVFAEHVFYRYVDGRVADVRSLVDVEAVRRQVGT
jgi:predicted ester cyclase